MGVSMNNPSSSSSTQSLRHTHKIFLFCNYALLGAASSCIFLTLSLRLLPSAAGALLILLHLLTITAAVAGISTVLSSGRWHGVHMSATVMAAILQGSVAVLAYTRTSEFLGWLKSYVREEDGDVILKLAGGLCIVIFCLEWVVLALAFALRYHCDSSDGKEMAAMGKTGKVHEEDMSHWPWPFQV
ncbi:hypothetical protein NMG60_11008303 [Bertholletia excelsa]